MRWALARRCLAADRSRRSAASPNGRSTGAARRQPRLSRALWRPNNQEAVMTDSPLRILLMAAEMVPFAKTGGLADVTGALPKALKAQGHDIRVAMPRYGRVDRERFELTVAAETFTVTIDDHDEPVTIMETAVRSPDGDIPVYMIDNQHYYDRDGIYMYEDDADRFIFFCRATLEGIKLLGWQPDVIHC